MILLFRFVWNKTFQALLWAIIKISSFFNQQMKKQSLSEYLTDFRLLNPKTVCVSLSQTNESEKFLLHFCLYFNFLSNLMPNLILRLISFPKHCINGSKAAMFNVFQHYKRLQIFDNLLNTKMNLVSCNSKYVNKVVSLRGDVAPRVHASLTCLNCYNCFVTQAIYIKVYIF